MYYKNLLSPGKLGNLELKNKVLFPPMGTNFVDHGKVTDRLIAYHERRAKGGVSMCIVEATSVHFASYGDNLLCLDDDKYMPGMKKLAAAIKANGAHAAIQLSHFGRQHSSAACGCAPWGPSPIPCPYMQEMPHEMTIDDIHEVIRCFGDAAERAVKCGFEAIEIHAAHGYLLDSFINAYSNQRTDEYGGSFENRCRFPIEVIREVRSRVGADFPLAVRMSVRENYPGGITAEEGVEVAKKYEAAGVSAIDISQGCYGALEYTIPPYWLNDEVNVPLAKLVKQSVDIPVIVAGNIHSPDEAERILSEGSADFISMGRVHLADPDFVNKLLADRPDEIVRCIACDQGCAQRYFTSTVSCVFNPEAGFETERVVKPAEKVKRVVVIGGGPAGLEAATIAARRGHQVTLLEKTGELGGQFIIAGRSPHKKHAEMAIRHMGYMAEKAGVDIRLYTAADAERVKALNPDAIIVATGSAPFIPKIKGVDAANVYEARALINGDVRIHENNVAVIGGGIVGLEAADFLIEQGKTVCIIEMLDQIGADLEYYVEPYMSRMLKNHQVAQYTGSKCVAIGTDGITVEKDGKEERIPAEAAVIAVGGRSDADGVYSMVKDLAPECYVIGDAKHVGKVIEAIWQGYDTANAL